MSIENTYAPPPVVEYDHHQTVVIFRSIGIKRLQTDPANFAIVAGDLPKKKLES